jgi:HKD family nuclease
MLIHDHVTQPLAGESYVDIIASLLKRGKVEAIDIAVAYVTRGGVDALLRTFMKNIGSEWPKVKKRCLIGFDYCRTEPDAVETLGKAPAVTIKVHDGAAIVTKKLCTPRIPFHPKTFIFRTANRSAVLCGSGNLSASGLKRGHEVGCLIDVENPKNPAEASAQAACVKVQGWFNGLWSKGTPVNSVFNAYSSIYESVDHLRAPSATDDDLGDTDTLSTYAGRRGALSSVDLRQLRTCRRFWIEAGNLHLNRGPGAPGNQLMMSRMTRVFFGFPARDVGTDTTIGQVAIRYGGHVRPDCSLRFSNNSMDVLGLPVPGTEGPTRYDKETLIFTRLPGGTFELQLGTVADRTKWIQRSKAIDALHTMTSGRKWGVF